MLITSVSGIVPAQSNVRNSGSKIPALRATARVNMMDDPSEPAYDTGKFEVRDGVSGDAKGTMAT